MQPIGASVAQRTQTQRRARSAWGLRGLVRLREECGEWCRFGFDNAAGQQSINNNFTLHFVNQNDKMQG